MHMMLPFLLRMIILFALFTGMIFLIYHFIVRPLLKTVQPPAQSLPSGSEELKILLPLRLQACERFVLFLERINPNNLLLRVSQPGQGARELQALLIRTIREEFEYNLSQQLYVSQGTWELIRSAKEEAISLVNRAADRLPEGTDASDLSRAILDLSMERDKLPSAKAIDAVKTEIRLM
jgi:hypothetical protein